MRAFPRCWSRLTFGLLLCASPPLAGQAVLMGTVKEDSSGRPLSKVEVVLEGTKKQTTTDSEGRYFLGDLPTGNRVALFRFIGYRPSRVRVILEKHDTTTADAVLVSDQVRLAPVVVTGTPDAPRGLGREGMAERMKLGFGKFVDSVALRRAEGRRVSDVLRGVGGIQILEYRETMPNGVVGPREMRAASGRVAGFDLSPCWMTVIYDGVTLYRSMSRGKPPDFLSMFSVANLEAIEVYRTEAETPLEFGGPGQGCGTLVIWSKRFKK